MNFHHKHIHPGRPSSIFFTSDQVLDILEIKEGNTILDAGCGDGFISIAASRLVGDTGKVFAVDVDVRSIEMLNQGIEQNNIGNMEAIRADLSKTIPIENNIIDICIMVNVFHGIFENNEVESVIKEIKRVGKTGGTFAIIEFKKVESYPGPPKSIRLDPELVESILKEYDFEREDYVEIGKYHYGLLFRNS